MEIEILNTDALENGVTVILDEETNASVTVRSPESKIYSRTMQNKLLRERYQSRQGTMSETQKTQFFEKLSEEMFYEVIVVGWENITVNKQPFPYNLDNAKLVATNKAYLPFKKQIMDASGADVAFRQSMIDGVVKN